MGSMRVEPCMYWVGLKVWPCGRTRMCPMVGFRMVLLVKKNHLVVKYMYVQYPCYSILICVGNHCFYV